MRSSDRRRARQLLEHRAKGFSITRVLWQSLGAYLILAAFIATLIAIHGNTDRPSVRAMCLWGGGVFCGVFLRDCGWLHRIKRGWPLTEKLTDWRKVEAVAAGRDPDEPDTEQREPDGIRDV
ncbi:MAG: hypothetical protein KGQ61_00520 [Planctomycetes bacterium]|nr:hypothetical protein [Planctomycetota bacterium]